MSLDIRLETIEGAITATIKIPLDKLPPFWSDLVKRNETFRARDGRYCEVSKHGRKCPQCKSHPVNHTIVDEDIVWRVCRKCNFYFSRT